MVYVAFTILICATFVRPVEVEKMLRVIVHPGPDEESSHSSDDSPKK